MENLVNQAVNPADPNTVPKFVDPLPRPAVLAPSGQVDDVPLYEIDMIEAEHQFHRDFPLTTVWTYNGTYPGPTIEARRNRPIAVQYSNHLPTKHLLTVDTTVHGAEPFRPEVRNVTHLHGANVPATFDGNPDAWFTPGFAETGPLFETALYRYPNRQPAALLWYHDHALGITRLNVYAGLAGLYPIRDRADERLRLPSGPFEVPLVIQDKQFNGDGSLFYPPTIQPEFFGNTILVNGKAWPFLDVEPRRYRFRVVNGSNSRFYRLTFDPPLTMVQIGAEGGFLREPASLTELLIGPAERPDLIIDFTGLEGQSFTLRNSAETPFPGGDLPDANTSVVMQFRVSLPLSCRDRSRIPTKLPKSFPQLRPKRKTLVRDVTLNERIDDMGRVTPLLGIRDSNGRPLPLTWGDSTTERPRLGSTEVWRLINTTMDTHPIHLHLVRFLILDRQPFDVDRLNTTGELVFTGPPVPADPNENGPKDTVRANPGEVTRIITRFCDYPGDFVWHCHILEHEDHDMMRRMFVVPDPDANC